MHPHALVHLRVQAATASCVCTHADAPAHRDSACVLHAGGYGGRCFVLSPQPQLQDHDLCTSCRRCSAHLDRHAHEPPGKARHSPSPPKYAFARHARSHAHLHIARVTHPRAHIEVCAHALRGSVPCRQHACWMLDVVRWMLHTVRAARPGAAHFAGRSAAIRSGMSGASAGVAVGRLGLTVARIV
jgi:hypothetical protein